MEGLTNEVMEENILLFYQKLMNRLPQYFETQQINVIDHSDYKEAVVHLSKQSLLEYFTDDLVKEFGLYVYLATKEENSKYYRVIVYPRPDEENMFVIYLSSQNYGLTDSMTIVFYDSVDVMYTDMLKNTQYINAQPAEILEREPIDQTLEHFYLK